MAAQFCTGCGKPMASDARFCAGCGTPVTGGSPPGGVSASPPAGTSAAPSAPAGPVPAAAPPPPAGAPPAMSGPSLNQVLGLVGVRNFLVQHQLFSGQRNYRVLNHEKRHLFTVKEDMRQELMSNILGNRASAAVSGFSFHMGREQAAPTNFTWTVADASGGVWGTITIQVTGNNSVATMTDSSGNPQVAVNVDRSMMGGLSATAAFPDGRSMFVAHGNLLRHSFMIKDANGQDVAKIHEAWASIRDTYNLDLTANVDPLCPLIFAILIDREKQAADARR